MKVDNRGKWIRTAKSRMNLSIARKGLPAWNKDLKGVQVAWNKGLTKLSHEAIVRQGRKLSDTRKIKKWSCKPMLGKKHSLETRELMSLHMRGIPKSDNFKRLMSIRVKGKNNPAYNPNSKLTQDDRFRNSVEYVKWRKAVFERDKYTCQICWQVGGNLNADHIKPFSVFLESRLDLDNGRTLCVECHRKTSTYARGAKNYKIETNV